MCHQFHPQHLARQLAGLFGTLSQLHAATFATTAGVDLRFDYDRQRRQLFRRRVRFVGRMRDDAARHRHVEFFQ